MKITILTTIHGRDNTTDACLKHWQNHFNHFKAVRWRLSASISNYTPTINDDRFTLFKHKNKPIGAKLNAAMELTTDADYVITTGSDNFYSTGLIERYIELANKGVSMCGLKDFYFVDLVTDEAIHFLGFSREAQGYPIGAGKMISKEILKKHNHRIWDNELNKNLSKSCWNKIGGEPFELLHLNGDVAIDIKNGNNLTAISEYRYNSEPADFKELLIKVGLK